VGGPAQPVALWYCQVITQSLGGVVQYYNLLPDENWAVDLAHLEAQIDSRTKAILVNNPSNPCGNVLSRENLEGVLAIAERHRLPVIADEIYGKMTFTGHVFYPMASLTTTVPVLAVGGCRACASP
jgi:tyrosine aminotransferase